MVCYSARLCIRRALKTSAVFTSDSENTPLRKSLILSPARLNQNLLPKFHKGIADAKEDKMGHTGSRHYFTEVRHRIESDLGYDAGQIANLFCAIKTETLKEARIIGTKGSIHIPEFWQATSATLIRFGRDPVHIEIPFKSNGYENQAIEVINCLREGKLESDVMPLDESLSIMKTMDTIRFQWGLRYPEFRSIFATPT